MPAIEPAGASSYTYQSRGFGAQFAHVYPALRRADPRPIPKSKYLRVDHGLGLDDHYAPSNMNSLSYFSWITKTTLPRGVPLTTEEYYRSLNDLKEEFGLYADYSVSTLDEVMSEIDMSKSPGLPYVNEGCSTKYEAWQEQSHIIMQRVNDLLNGKMPDCGVVMIATLKDELLKVTDGKIKDSRVFCPAPFHHQIACAILFQKTCKSLTATWGKHRSVVGMDPFRQGLVKSFAKLSKHPNGHDFDQTGCDVCYTSVEPERDFFLCGLPQEYHAGGRLLFSTAICPEVQIDDAVYQMMFNPSGWFLTTFLNTLRTYRLFIECICCVFGLTREEAKRLWESIHGGDDAAQSQNIPGFDVQEFARWLREKRGCILETNVLEARDPMELTFYSSQLVHRYVECLGRTIPVPLGRLDKLLSAFSFVKLKSGKIDYLASASRVNGLMANLWPAREIFDALHPYAFHLVQHFFLQSGLQKTPEWEGIIRSIPHDRLMVGLWADGRHEGLVFSPNSDGSAGNFKIRFKRPRSEVLQSKPKMPSEAKKMRQQLKQKLRKKEARLRAARAAAPIGPLAKKESKLEAKIAYLTDTINALKVTSMKQANMKPKSKASKNNRLRLLDANGSVNNNGTAVPFDIQRAGKIVKRVGGLLSGQVGTQIAEVIVDLAGAIFSTSLKGRLTRHHSHHGWSPKFNSSDTIPAGTILFTVPISPYMCRLPENRLTQQASIKSFFNFSQACIKAIPSESSFVGGSIALFIVPDPALQVTLTDPEAVQALVAEFDGVVCRIDKACEICVPPPQRILSTDDFTVITSAADVRDYYQGRLYCVAFSDIPPNAVLPALAIDIDKPVWSGNVVPGVQVVPTISTPTAAVTLTPVSTASNSPTIDFTVQGVTSIGDGWITHATLPATGVTLQPGNYLAFANLFCNQAEDWSAGAGKTFSVSFKLNATFADSSATLFTLNFDGVTNSGLTTGGGTPQYVRSINASLMFTLTEAALVSFHASGGDTIWLGSGTQSWGGRFTFQLLQSLPATFEDSAIMQQLVHRMGDHAQGDTYEQAKQMLRFDDSDDYVPVPKKKLVK